MDKKTIAKLDEINRRNKKPNTICHGFFWGNDLALVTIQDIYPDTKNGFSFFISVELDSINLHAGGYASGGMIFFPDFKLVPEFYLQGLHRTLLVHAAGIGRKHKKNVVLFLVPVENVFHSLNIPFWKLGFKKSSGSTKTLYTYAANLVAMAGD